MHFKNNFFCFLILFCFVYEFTQAQTKEVDDTFVNPSCGCPYTIAERRFAIEEELTLHVDTAASFKGGEHALQRYEERLIQNAAQNMSDSTKYSLLCRFIVERNGSITHLEYLNHTDKIFESEAKRFMETMPRWLPAKKGGKPVRSWHSLRLFFGYPKTN